MNKINVNQEKNSHRLGSDTLSKWQNLASQNVKDGFNVSDVSPTKEAQPSSFGDILGGGGFTTDDSNSITEDNATTSVNTLNKKMPTIRKPLKPHKQSTPAVRGTPSETTATTSVLRGLETPKNTKRTILTRNSSALNSLRKGRKMLRSNEKDGRSKTEVIDMIANAMNKANVEAKAGQRILSSLNNSVGTTPRRESIRQRAETLTKSPELLQEMPNVTRVLEKVTQNIDALGLTSSDLDSEIDDVPPPLPASPSRVPEELNSVSGPLGLLNRADLNEPNPTLRNRLMRMSSTDKMNGLQPPLDSKHTLTTSSLSDKSMSGVRRNKSSGSLVDMMVSGKLHSGFRPMGLTNLVNSTGSVDGGQNQSAGLLGLLDNTTTSPANSSSAGALAGTPSSTSRTVKSSSSLETGLNNAQTPPTVENNNSGGGGFGFFSSFLGKLS